MAVTPQRRIEILTKQVNEDNEMLKFHRDELEDTLDAIFFYKNKRIFKLIEILELETNKTNKDFKKLDEGIFLLKKPRVNKGKLRFYYLDDKIEGGFYYEDMAVDNKGLDLC